MHAIFQGDPVQGVHAEEAVSLHHEQSLRTDQADAQQAAEVDDPSAHWQLAEGPGGDHQEEVQAEKVLIFIKMRKGFIWE